MRARHSGFTLIELMVVVAIIGLLSSVAIPTYQNLQLRSRQAERAMMFTSIHTALKDYWIRESRYPEDWGGGFSGMWANANPDWNPGSFKRPWRIAGPAGDQNWRRLSLEVQGGVYYSYYISAWASPPTRSEWVVAIGDLDGNRIWDEFQKNWQYNGETMQRWGWSNCSDCTNEWRFPPNSTEF